MSLHDDPGALKRIHHPRLVSRDIDQLIGICEFALQDGHIDQQEAEAILSWLTNHPSCLDTWPASLLFDQLRIMLADDVLDDDEQRDLLGLIVRISTPRDSNGASAPSPLPLDTPIPKIIIPQRTFCFTGVFEFGSRTTCHEAVLLRGGEILKGVNKKLNYLVIGNIGSETWKHSSFGDKIMKSVDYRAAGVPIAIVSETDWANTLHKHPL